MNFVYLVLLLSQMYAEREEKNTIPTIPMTVIITLFHRSLKYWIFSPTYR